MKRHRRLLRRDRRGGFSASTELAQRRRWPSFLAGNLLGAALAVALLQPGVSERISGQLAPRMAAMTALLNSSIDLFKSAGTVRDSAASREADNAIALSQPEAATQVGPSVSLAPAEQQEVEPPAAERLSSPAPEAVVEPPARTGDAE
jgi:hypothetical protein